MVGHGGGEAGGGRGEPWTGKGGRGWEGREGLMKGEEETRGGYKSHVITWRGGRWGGRKYGKGKGERDGGINREANAYWGGEGVKK